MGAAGGVTQVTIVKNLFTMIPVGRPLTGR
jgi:hypothetical protein